MSEYQARKARAMEIQREKEEGIRREMAAKAERQRLKAQEEEAREKRREEASKEARRQELMRANEELIRRAAGGSSSTSAMDYDPFAEDMKPAISTSVPKATSTLSKKPAGTSSHASGSTPRTGTSATRSRPTQSRTTSTTRNSSSPSQVLGRKEKAARLFAQKAKKAAPADSLFSVRALVESHEPLARRSSPSWAGTRHGLQKSSSGQDMRQGAGVRGQAKGTGSAGTSISGGSVRSQVAKNHVDGLRRLCPDRSTRDRRSIDEIQRDIKARKGGSSNSLGKEKDERAERNGRETREGKAAGSSMPASASKALPSRLESQRISSPMAKRRRPSTPSESDTSSESASVRDRRPPASRRPTEHSGQPNLQETLAELFGRGYQKPDWDYDSDASDMEADLEEVRREERRAAALARKEDEEAERLEAKRKAEKALNKQRLKDGRD